LTSMTLTSLPIPYYKPYAKSLAFAAVKSSGTGNPD